MTSDLTNNLIELEPEKVLSEVKERLNRNEDPMKIFEECKQGMERPYRYIQSERNP